MFFKRTQPLLSSLLLAISLMANGCAYDYSYSRTHQINYLAIGDSIAAGYDANVAGVDLGGSYDPTTQQVLGGSYSAAIARHIQQLTNWQLVNYHNIALSSSTVNDWNYFLNSLPSTKANYQPSERLEGLLSFYEKTKNHQIGAEVFANKIVDQFESFLNPNFTKVRNLVRDANLITISLGANDYLQSFYDLLQNLNHAGWSTNWKSYQSAFNLIAPDIVTKKIVQDYTALVKRIQSMSNGATIALISYPRPLLRMSYVIDELITTTIKSLVPNSILTQLGLVASDQWWRHFSIGHQLHILNNEIVKATAQQTGVAYYDAFNEPYWETNAHQLAHHPLDIHPSAVGYQVMGADLFLKMALHKPQDHNNYLDLSSGSKFKVGSYHQTSYWSDQFLVNGGMEMQPILQTTKHTDAELVAKIRIQKDFNYPITPVTNNATSSLLHVMNQSINALLPPNPNQRVSLDLGRLVTLLDQLDATTPITGQKSFNWSYLLNVLNTKQYSGLVMG